MNFIPPPAAFPATEVRKLSTKIININVKIKAKEFKKE